MKHYITTFLIFTLIGLFPILAKAQCTFTSTGNGNWLDPTTWTNSCQDPNLSLPGEFDAVIIQPPHTITLNSVTTVQVASILFQNQGNNGASLVVSGSATELIVGPTGGTNQNVLVLEGKNNITLDGALLTITGALYTTNNGNSITSGTNQGFLSIETCARQGGQGTDIGDVGTGCLGQNFFNGSSLVYCARCPGCNSVNGVQQQSPGGCGLILLPITLIKLEANYKANEGITVEWATISEIDNDYFEIEHSITGENFKSIGKVEGFGNKESVTEYTFLDANCSEEINYYRLKQVDFDGTFTYTKVVVVRGKSLVPAHLLIYPNPTKGNTLSLQLSTQNEILSVEIFNTLGEMVHSVKNPTTTNKLTVKLITHLPKGIYLAKILTKEGIHAEHFLVE